MNSASYWNPNGISLVVQHYVSLYCVDNQDGGIARLTYRNCSKWTYLNKRNVAFLFRNAFFTYTVEHFWMSVVITNKTVSMQCFTRQLISLYSRSLVLLFTPQVNYHYSSRTFTQSDVFGTFSSTDFGGETGLADSIQYVSMRSVEAMIWTLRLFSVAPFNCSGAQE